MNEKSKIRLDSCVVIYSAIAIFDTDGLFVNTFYVTKINRNMVTLV